MPLTPPPQRWHQRWHNRLLAVLGTLVASVLMFATPASAVTYQCVWVVGTSWADERGYWSDWASNGADIRQDGRDTYATSPTWYGTSYDKELWKGTVYRCPVGSNGCDYAWGQSKTSTSSWNISAWIQGSYGAQKGYGGLLALTPSYGRTTSYTTTFTYTVHMYAGQYAQPYQATHYTPEAYHLMGSWVSAGKNGTQCIGGDLIAYYGYTAYWDPNKYSADWHADVRQYEFNSYYLWY